MTYRSANARKEFDRWSRRYDRNPLQKLLFHPSHRMMLDALTPNTNRILDVGCGTGQLGVQILKSVPHARFVGFDLSDRMLTFASKRLAATDRQWSLVQGDSEHLPFADDFFDLITCAHSFHHYPKQRRVLSEMHRVLRHGGQLMIIDGDRDRFWGRFLFDIMVVLCEGAVHHLPSRTFRRLYQEVGFDQIRQRRRRGLIPFLLTIGRAVKNNSGGTKVRPAA